MGARTAHLGPLLIGSVPFAWYEPDALFAWSAFTDTNATQVDPILGGVLPQTSAGSATPLPGTGFWDMTSGVYAGGATGTTASINTANPFGIAIVADRFNQGGTFVTMMEFGAASYIQFTTNSGTPRFNYGLNFAGFSQTALCAPSWTSGAPAVYWTYCNPADATATLRYGFNQTTNVSSGVLTVPTTNLPARNVTYGAAQGSTTPVTLAKFGAVQCIGNRTGGAALTLAQWLVIVQKMQTLYGL